MSDQNRKAGEPANALFVYGTLRRGESRHHMLATAGITSIIPASTAGCLLDLREYPGLVASESDSQVKGELVTLKGFLAISSVLDEEEGRDFRREVRKCVDYNGRSHWAWVYIYVGDRRDAKRIESGDWLRR